MFIAALVAGLLQAAGPLQGRLEALAKPTMWSFLGCIKRSEQSQQAEQDLQTAPEAQEEVEQAHLLCLAWAGTVMAGTRAGMVLVEVAARLAAQGEMALAGMFGFYIGAQTKC